MFRYESILFFDERSSAFIWRNLFFVISLFFFLSFTPMMKIFDPKRIKAIEIIVAPDIWYISAEEVFMAIDRPKRIPITNTINPTAHLRI